MNKVLYVGMDVHKESIVAATAEGASGEVDMFVRFWGRLCIID
ncbi:hypothetical protein [Desulfatibacillum aliphaticivorans]|nr:hypothetical protein [Desulfatibacillum aliphaticivorans]